MSRTTAIQCVSVSETHLQLSPPDTKLLHVCISYRLHCSYCSYANEPLRQALRD
jgi:hypothetical protein